MHGMIFVMSKIYATGAGLIVKIRVVHPIQ